MAFGCAVFADAQTKTLYGVASNGGSANRGVLFGYELSTGTYSIKKHLTSVLEGSMPRGSLVNNGNGKLYGTTWAGGSTNGGTLFEYDIATDTHSVKVNFNGQNGGQPYGSLIRLENGKYYGMTSKGGTANLGTLYEYDEQTNSITVKVNFTGANGSLPHGNLVLASNGKLYGMTYWSSNFAGVLFEYDLSTNVQEVKFTFNTVNGSNPYGDLIELNGKLYGMTKDGGTSGYGTLFEYDLATSVLTKKLEFNGVNGRNPMGKLILADNGKLYGLASGGIDGNGLIFEYDHAANVYTIKAEFNSDNGFNPLGSLMQASNGKLYGLASYGGVIDDYNYEYGEGTMFSYDIATNTITKLLDFDGTNGSTPYYTTLIEVETSSLSTTDVAASAVQVYPNPVEDILHIKGSRNAQVSVYTMAGQQVFTGAATNGQVNLSSLSKGVYIVKIEADGNVSTHKIVKK